MVYAVRPGRDMEVTISTCGSAFDTTLLLATDLNDRNTYACNDDDRSCGSNPSASRLDARLKAQTTYFIVVSGFSGASGAFSLSVVCTSCAAA